MPKTITIDSALVLQVRLMVDHAGKVRVYSEYQLKSGTRAIESLHEEVTLLLTSSDQAAARAFLDAVVQAIGADQGVPAATA